VKKLGCLVRWSAGVLAVLLAAGVVAYFLSSNTCGESAAAVPGPTMKAVVYCDYGTSGVLRLEDVEKPVPADDQVLVRVRAASVNPLDWHYMRGTPYVMRLGAGMRKPKVTRLGVDFSGTVEAVGRSVTRFKPGDDVFGGRTGAFAEYVTVREDRAIAAKPANVTFEQAASVSIAAVTALQGLRDKGKLRSGQTVLINGASGGVGTFAVQIAKSMGATVTGVCSGKNAAMVRSIGADDVVDYTKEDFTRSGKRYDLILDCVGNRSLLDLRRALNPRGICVLIGGGGPNDGKWIGPLAGPVKTLLLSPFVSQKLAMFLAELRQADLSVLAGLMEAGKVKPVIDRRYPLSEIATAIAYLEQGHAKGKVVLDVEEAAAGNVEK
jgi:NADPH:quinone reductase-like Zn-dependent oxidoreductase